MEGFNSAEERGIIPRAIEQIFKHIQTTLSPRMRFLVRASYLQIYNEVISDLLKPERTNLVIREDKKKVCAWVDVGARVGMGVPTPLVCPPPPLGLVTGIVV
jgi:hypothetical protein